MAFWVHFTTQSAGTVFALLWGIPFLTTGEGLSRLSASALITLFVLTNAVMGPVIGGLTASNQRLMFIVINAVPLSAMVAWAVVLLQPGKSPEWLLAILVVVLGLGGPTSMLAFDYSRRYVSARQLGGSNGFINIGGFMASLLMMFVVGVALDFANTGSDRSSLYSLEHFRVAIPVQFVFTFLGLVFFNAEHARTQRHESPRE
jgi:MFS family permease